MFSSLSYLQLPIPRDLHCTAHAVCCVCVCVRARVNFYAFVCVRVSACARAYERERESARARALACERGREGGSVCVRVRGGRRGRTKNLNKSVRVLPIQRRSIRLFSKTTNKQKKNYNLNKSVRVLQIPRRSIRLFSIRVHHLDDLVHTRALTHTLSHTSGTCKCAHIRRGWLIFVFVCVRAHTHTHGRRAGKQR